MAVVSGSLDILWNTTNFYASLVGLSMKTIHGSIDPVGTMKYPFRFIEGFFRRKAARQFVAERLKNTVANTLPHKEKRQVQ